MNIFEEISLMKRQGEAGVLVTVVDKLGDGPGAVGKKLLLYKSGVTKGTVGGGDLERIALEKSRELLDSKSSMLQSYDLNIKQPSEEAISLNMVCGGQATLYYEYIEVTPTVYIFGAGHVGRCMVALLKELDYNIVLVDDRENLETERYDVRQLYVGDYSSIIADMDFSEESYIIVSSYSHEIEYQVLKALYLRDIKARYIGLLASAKKAEHILAKLEEELELLPDYSNLHAPIGLDIGGKAPFEVALSIASELQAIRYGRQGNKHMSLQWVREVEGMKLEDGN